jgi:hypothetical protein
MGTPDMDGIRLQTHLSALCPDVFHCTVEWQASMERFLLLSLLTMRVHAAAAVCRRMTGFSLQPFAFFLR